MIGKVDLFRYCCLVQFLMREGLKCQFDAFTVDFQSFKDRGKETMQKLEKDKFFRDRP
jgi:hypothetical protein